MLLALHVCLSAELRADLLQPSVATTLPLLQLLPLLLLHSSVKPTHQLLLLVLLHTPSTMLTHSRAYSLDYTPPLPLEYLAMNPLW
jgi:hypothetical protein